MSNIELKIVLLGAEYCGKTSLIERFLNQRFIGENQYQNTVGVVFGSRTSSLDDRTVVVGVWDTAGSERYDAVSRIYYRGAKAAIICYDVTSPSTWERVEHWLDQLRRHEDTCRVYICGNKIDLLDRKVDQQKVLNFAEEVSEKEKSPVRVYETSSKTGENVEDMFDDIVRDFVDEPRNSLTEFNKALKLNVDSVDSGNKRPCCLNF